MHPAIDVDLSRDAGLAMNSVLFVEEKDSFAKREAFVKEIEKAKSYENLSKETTDFIRKCLTSS